jgi:hypothetical protein
MMSFLEIGFEKEVRKMYCQKCGKENPEGAKFCMHCGADLSGYKVEISPKISVTAKAEGGVALKGKKKPEKYAEIKGIGKLPVFHDFVEHGDAYFCPQCGNYGSLEKITQDTLSCCESGYHSFVSESGTYEVLKQEDEWVWIKYEMFRCLACEKLSLLQDKTSYSSYHNVLHIRLLEYVYLEFTVIGKTPIYSWCKEGDESRRLYACSPANPTCPICGTDSKQVVSSLFRKKILKFGWYSTNYVVYDLWKCQACGFQFLTEKEYKSENPTSCDVHIYTLCEVCENGKAEYTCSSCGKPICENCAIPKVFKKGIFSKETVNVCQNYPFCAR